VSGVEGDIAVFRLEAIPAEALLHLAGSLPLALDPQGRILWVDDQTRQFLAKKSEDLLGRDFFETFVHGSDRAEARSRFEQVLADGTRARQPYDCRIRTLDGRDRITRWKYIRLSPGSGRIGGVLCVGDDVTEAKQREVMLEGLASVVAQRLQRVLSSAAAEIDAVVAESLAAVGQHLEVDCVWAARLLVDGSVETGPIWMGPTAPIDWRKRPMESYPSQALARQIRRDGSFVGGQGVDLAEQPREQRSDGLATFSGFAVGSEGDGEGTEGLALLSSQAERPWPQEIVAPLACLSSAIWTALRRHQLEARLREELGRVSTSNAILKAENDQLKQELGPREERAELVGRSAAMQSVLHQVELVAPTNASVLLLGETGTGKEIVATAIHHQSARSDRRMIKVNCAALPTGLAEAELFGREKGAYTGADSSQAGRFELADGSTLFLDEVTELDLGVQAKLLRVLQDGEFERVGSTKTTRVNVRVIAASNRDPEELVAQRLFRKDLYYRLNVFPIRVPPLRDHPEDIPGLVWTFAWEFGESIGKPIERIPQQTMAALQSYEWPGNVRELRNVVERAVILSDGGVLSVTLPQAASAPATPAATLSVIERQYILQVLERVGWQVRGSGGAAEVLGLKPTTLESRMRKLGIERPNERRSSAGRAE
jgi:PAS domain S-box-containing protein